MTTVAVQRFAAAWKKLVPDQPMPASRDEAKKLLDGLGAQKAAPALQLLKRVDDGAYRDMLDESAGTRAHAETMLSKHASGAVTDEGRRGAQSAAGKPPAHEGATARLGPGMQVAYSGMSMPMPIEPPPFPSAADIASKKDASMPKAAVDMVKGMKTGEMHAQWHTTRDFAFTMQELDANSADPKTKAVLTTWKALRDAHLGVPSAKPPAGTKVDPKQKAFVDAMNAFATANAKSKDENISDVVSTWKQVQKQNWPIPARAEGDAGNGLDFLAMHHEMVLMMKNMLGPETKKMSAADQQTMRALDGWTHFPAPAPWPYDAASSTAGVAKATTAVNMLNALLTVDAKNTAAVAAFKQQFQTTTGVAFDSASPDQFGAWIQSSAAGMPNSGVHNWMHNEYEVPNSKTEMDSFVLNVENPHFWGLHGTIDNAFMKFMKLRGLSVDNPDVKAALKEQAAEMGMELQPEHGGMPMPMKGGMKGMPGVDVKPFEEMSTGLKDVIALAQKHAVARGNMH